MVLLVVVCVCISNWSTICSVLGKIGTLYNYNSDQISYLGMAYILSGIMGNFIIGPLAIIQNRHKFYMVLLAVSGVFADVALTGTLQLESFSVTMVLGCIAGFLNMPNLPVGMSLVTRVAFPVGEAMSIGLILTVSTALSAGEIALCEFLMEKYPDQVVIGSTISIGILIVMKVLSLLALNFLRGK